MALIPTLEIVGTEDNDDLIAAPTRPRTGLGDNNVILGLGGDDRLEAGGGDDLLAGGFGDDFLDGGGGLDTAFYSQPREAYEIFRYDTAGGRTDAVVTGPDGIDAVLSLEFLSFQNSSGIQVRVPLADFAPFPAVSYVASYPDLASAFGSNLDFAWLHFRDFGVKEGRTATFSGLQYVAGYEDLTAVFGPLGNAQSISNAGTLHYLTNGRAEGRQPDNFDPNQYLANYPDLGAAGLDTPDALALHYITIGRAAGLTFEVIA